MIARRLLSVALAVAAVLAAAGCELVFSASPFSFLARDPSRLAPAALEHYAQEALVSGKADAMRAAYDALLASWDDFADDAHASYLAGRLAVELSGMGSVVDLLLRGEILIFGDTALADMEAAASTLVTDTALALAAAEYLAAAAAGGAELQGTDYMLGAFGYFIGACETAGGIEYLDDPGSWSAAAVAQVEQGAALLTQAAALYTADDPALVFINGFLAFYEQYTS